MDRIGIIPARYGSTRFEGKLLADLCGKPVLQHTWENAKKSKSLDELIIATDDKRIYNVARGFGAKVVYTSRAHRSGSDRITEVVSSIDARIIVNIQADEPLLHPTMIDDVVLPLEKDSSLYMVTLCHKISDKNELDDPNIVKVVFDRNGFALYFSRYPIPYRQGFHQDLSDRKKDIEKYKDTEFHYKHIGIYAYTKDFLFTFKSLPESRLEKAERLEQLRVLENGYRIKVVETKYDTVGIDTPEDLVKAIDIIKGARQLSFI